MVLTAAHSVHALLLKLQLHLGPYETHTDTHVYIYIYIYLQAVLPIEDDALRQWQYRASQPCIIGYLSVTLPFHICQQYPRAAATTTAVTATSFTFAISSDACKLTQW
jgi:hypothetical protein